MIVVNRAEVERLMVEKNVTRYDLLKTYKMSYITFNDVITGNRNVSMKSVGVLCDALNCQPKDILMKVDEC